MEWLVMDNIQTKWNTGNKMFNGKEWNNLEWVPTEWNVKNEI